MPALIILPILALGFALLYAAGAQALRCADNQIYIPVGLGGACVRGHW